jgi:Kef-type K+ transport system membrane component KefB
VELHLISDIIIIFSVSIGVNLLFNRMKLPTVVGYLLTGIIIGPHLLSLVKEKHEIEILAEIGVAMLLFTIGMEFSLKHLLKIRKVVFFGGLLQVSISALAFFSISIGYNLTWKTALFIGFLSALSSSALVLKLLQERSELTSNYGRTVLGILIFQGYTISSTSFILKFTDRYISKSRDRNWHPASENASAISAGLCRKQMVIAKASASNCDYQKPGTVFNEYPTYLLLGGFAYL